MAMTTVVEHAASSASLYLVDNYMCFRHLLKAYLFLNLLITYF